MRKSTYSRQTTGRTYAEPLDRMFNLTVRRMFSLLSVYCRLTFAYTIWVLLRRVLLSKIVVNFVLLYCYGCQRSLSVHTCMIR
jgi:hypothetical protein